MGSEVYQGTLVNRAAGRAPGMLARMETDRLRRRRVGDLFVVGLAVASVGLVAYSILGDLDDGERLTVFYLDCGICALFLAEFLTSWRATGWRGTFLLRNWYDGLSMIPVAHPVFIEGGWTVILWVLVVAARIGRAVDRLVGERVFAAVTSRLTSAVVESVKHPITVAVLDEVADVLQTGHYTKNIASALEENRSELKSMILQKLEADRLTGKVTLLPFHDTMIDMVSETALRVIFAVLADPRTDELVADLLRENIVQLREEVRAKEYRKGDDAVSAIPPSPRVPPRRPEADH